jgi:hypothetical protein
MILELARNSCRHRQDSQKRELLPRRIANLSRKNPAVPGIPGRLSPPRGE